MDASPTQNHHHRRHYHHHRHFICHHRHRHFICHHSPTPPPPPPAPALQNPEPAASGITPCSLNSETSRPAEAHRIRSLAAQMLQEQEYDEQVEEAYEDYDEEPVFVLTDEWKEFFAKSEAKRKLEKKQAKKMGKS